MNDYEIRYYGNKVKKLFEIKKKSLKSGLNNWINTIEEQISDLKDCTAKSSQNLSKMETIYFLKSSTKEKLKTNQQT